jgi:hypothetical protein
MRIFLVKDNYGELHSVVGDAVNYIEQGGRLVEARIVDDDGRVLAVFSQWSYIKPGPIIPPPGTPGIGTPPPPPPPQHLPEPEKH